MNKIPGNREVDRALKQAVRQVKSALKEINQEAGKLVTRGDYSGAEQYVQVGRSVTTFTSELEALHLRWRALQENTTSEDLNEKTALWGFYRPILQALVELGGESTVAQLEDRVEPLLTAHLKSGDLVLMSRGKPRWKVMIRRARRHMIKEGLVEEDSGKRWRISNQGRRVAEGATSPT